MDVVYVLGSGSVWNNNEIRYSIRSVIRNVIDLRYIYIIGEYPSFFSGIRHISCDDSFTSPWKNTYNKVKLACLTPQISQDFLLMNDDFFILRPIFCKSYPYYFFGDLFPRSHSTYSHLKSLNLPVKNFGIHCPIKINKTRFLSMPSFLDDFRAWSFRSFYSNYYSVPNVQRVDPYFSTATNPYDLARFCQYKTDFSIESQVALDPYFRDFISSLFPSKSVFEI